MDVTSLGYDCLYVTRFAYVLSTYELMVDVVDCTAIDHILNARGCARG